MNKYIKMAFASACCVLFAQCSDFLETSSPSNTDDAVSYTHLDVYKRQLLYCNLYGFPR